MKDFVILWCVVLILLGFIVGVPAYMHHIDQTKVIAELQTELNKKHDENSLLLEHIQQLQLEIKALKETIESQLQEIEDLKTIRARVTAYSPLDNVDGIQAQGNPNITSTGRVVSRGHAAADPRRLPYGTKLEVPGYGVVEIQDTGGALRADRKNIRLDLFHETYSEAMEFGIQNLEVKILEWGEVIEWVDKTS